MAAADYVSVVQQLYVAYFGRPADTKGLADFCAALDNAKVPATIKDVEAAYRTNADVKFVVDSFSTAPESTALYGSVSAETFVTSIYQNVLNRAPDLDGFNFWVKALKAGSVTTANASLSIMAAAKVNTTAQGLIDAKTVDNKIAVASNFTTAITTLGATFSGDADAAKARDLLKTVGDTTDVTAFQTKITATLTNAGETFTLTTGTDTIVGTAKNDTINATSVTLGATDAIVDSSTTDKDVLNLTLTGVNAAAKVAGIETINVDWNALGTATVDASNFTGATVKINSNKLGFAGNATVTNAASNEIVAGAAITNSFTVTTAKDVVVDANVAKTVSVTATSSAKVDASEATSVTVAGFKTATIDASSATTVSVTDNVAASTATDKWDATVTVGKNVTVNNAVEELTLIVADKVTATVNTIEDKLTVAGTGAVTIKSSGLHGETVVNNVTGTLTVESTAAGTAQDVSKVAASEIVFSGAVANTITAATGAHLRATTDLGATTFTTAAAVAAAGVVAGDSITATFTKDQTSVTATNIDTFKVVAAADQATAPTVTDLTFAVLDAGTNNVVLSGTNDVKVTLGTAKSFDASALVGALDYTQAAAAASAVTGGSGDNTVVFKATTQNVEFAGQDGKDAVTFVTTTGEAVASLGNGNNTVTANSAIQGAGTLTVLAGDGKDSISATGITSGKLVASLGAGDDAVTFGASLTSGTVDLNLGAGADKVTFGAATPSGIVTIDFGDGSDTLVVAGGTDLSGATVTFAGLETIELAASGATFAAKTLSGMSYAINGAGTVANGAFTDVITVLGTKAAGETINLSGLVLNSTLAKGIGGADITGNAGADTITGTDGNDIIATNGGNDTVTGGKGADSITLDAGNETVVINAGDSGKTAATIDSIDAFTSGSDKLKLGLAGSAGNYVESDLAAAANFTVAGAVTAANALFDGNVKFAVIANSLATGGDSQTDAILVVDLNGDKTADYAVKLVGLAITDIAFADIVA